MNKKFTQILLIVFVILAIVSFNCRTVYAQDDALRFDGVNDYVISPNLYNSFNGTSRTMELWFYADNEGVILAEQGTTSLDNLWYDSQIEIVGTTVKVSVWDSHTNVESLGTIVYNTWNHVVLRCYYSSRLLDGFLNGVKSTSTNVTIQNSVTGKLYYTIEANSLTNLGSEAWFKGKVDEVRIWSTTRSASEIRENMMRTLVGNENGLEAHYRFDQAAGSTLDDTTSNAYNGTLTNMELQPTGWTQSHLPPGWVQLVPIGQKHPTGVMTYQRQPIMWELTNGIPEANFQ